MNTLRDIGEDQLIDRLVARVPHDPSPAAGPGDDCAVIDLGPTHESLVLLKTDALVQGVHFLTNSPPHAVGWKAAARVISDFAAMGGTPKHFLITIALPPETPIFWLDEVYRGIGDCLTTFDAVVAGGETTAVPSGSAAVISIAATGCVARNQVVLRSTASAGDSLLVTGTLGGSIHGKHLSFTPRIEQAAWLTSHHQPTAMMDLSDGLAKDLPRLAKSSGCGFVIHRRSLPLTTGCTTENALGDGEDFELLIAIQANRTQHLLDDWRIAFPDLPLTVIGQLVDHGTGDTLDGGWEHFTANQTSPIIPPTSDA